MSGRVVPRPGLFERLARTARVAEVSAPAGSGKTVLLRSWIAEGGLGRSAGWVSVGPDERDPQRFWLSVFDALRDTEAGSALVRQLTAAPDLDPWAMVEWLLEDLSPLGDRLWLVVDDVHELRSSEALRQLELLLMRGPPELRFVLATRHDLRLGLHRLRLVGGLTEIRADDLRFSLDEARTLFAAAGVALADAALVQVHERTEGWAAGLRLAALLLAGHPDPERFTAEFSGTERTVAEYLLAEVLEHQPENVRRLLLRTSVLERVNGPLADLLTRALGGERILQELEAANAFVVSLDTGRSWFRYHQLFADLLQMELRRSEPDQIRALHSAAAEWFASHGCPVEAVRHAQMAQDWSLAARLLSDRWLGLVLDGQATTARNLLAAFPSPLVTGDAELAAAAAGVELASGSLEAAQRHLAVAERELPSVPPDCRARFEATLAVLRLQLARQRRDVPTLAEEANRLLAAAGAPETMGLELGEDLRAVALITLGTAESWTGRFTDAERHLDQGMALARRIRRPNLELTGLIAYGTALTIYRSYALGEQRCMQAVELAERHGWPEEPSAGGAYALLGATMVGQARLEEAERWLSRAERTLRAEAEPRTMVPLYSARGLLELVSGRLHDAQAAFETAEQFAGLLITPGGEFRGMVRVRVLQTLVRMGETGRCEQALAEMDDPERHSGQIAIAETTLRLAQGNPDAAMNALAPVLDGSAPVAHPLLKVEARVLEASVRDALGDTGAAGHALENALALAEPNGIRLPFLLHLAPELLERHRRGRTAHSALLSEILDLLAGKQPAQLASLQPLLEPLSETEVRVLRYLPTNLSQKEIAGQLYVSVATVKTHIHHVYAKLGVHGRRQAVDRARDLGLLAPSLHRS